MSESKLKVSRQNLFWLLGGLYLLALSPGFGAGIPPLSPPAIFMAALTVVVMGHLLNLHAVVKLDGYHRSGCLASDLLILVGVSVGIGLLAHPTTAGSGDLVDFVTPWDDPEALLSAIGGAGGGPARESVLTSLQRFFAASLVILAGLVVWHLAVRLGDAELELEGRGWACYIVGWVIFLVIALVGLDMTGCFGPRFVGSDVLGADWAGTYSGLWILSMASLLIATAFVVMIVTCDVTWVRNPGSSNTADRRG